MTWDNLKVKYLIILQRINHSLMSNHVGSKVTVKQISASWVVVSLCYLKNAATWRSCLHHLFCNHIFPDFMADHVWACKVDNFSTPNNLTTTGLKANVELIMLAALKIFQATLSITINSVFCWNTYLPINLLCIIRLCLSFFIFWSISNLQLSMTESGLLSFHGLAVLQFDHKISVLHSVP